MDCTCRLGFCAAHQIVPPDQLQQLGDPRAYNQIMLQAMMEQYGPMLMPPPFHLLIPPQMMMPRVVPRFPMPPEYQNGGEAYLMQRVPPPPPPPPQLQQQEEEEEEEVVEFEPADENQEQEEEPFHINVSPDTLLPRTCVVRTFNVVNERNVDETPNFFPKFGAYWQNLTDQEIVIDVMTDGDSYMESVEFERLEYSVGTVRYVNMEVIQTRDEVCRLLGLDTELDHIFYVLVKYNFRTIPGQRANEKESCLKCIQIE